MAKKFYHHHIFVSVFHNPFTAWIVLALSLGVTVIAYAVSNTIVNQRAQDRFNYLSEEITQAIQDRFDLYEQTLWGIVGLKNASDNVTREEFARFVSTLNISEHLPGIQGIGYSIPLRADELEDHIQSVRDEGFADYTVSPPGNRESYSAIIYLEPFDWRNRRAFGYDMWSNDIRKDAMIRARDQGVAAASGLITLVQETEEDIQSGFLIYLPVYRTRNTPTTLEQRRLQFKGWVYAPFRAGNLMDGILGQEASSIDFEIYDGDTIKADSLLYDSNNYLQGNGVSDNNQYSRTRQITLQGRLWTLYFSIPTTLDFTDNSQPLYIAAAGLAVDLLLFYLIYSLYLLNKRAESLGNEWRLVIEQAPNALITAKADGEIVMTNTRADELFGYPRGELVGQSVEVLVPRSIKKTHSQLRENFLAAPKARAMGAGLDLSGTRKDGSEVPIEIGLNPLHTQQGDFVVAAIVDITERLRGQSELQNINEQMAQKNQEMEQFIYTVSHDLKSPLVTIGGFAKRLSDSLVDTLDEKQAHQLQRITSNVQHMEGLLNDLLQLSRVIRQDLSKNHIVSETLIRSVLNTMEATITRVDGTVKIAHPLPDIYANESMIFQCLQNLIANALQYRHPDRPIAVEVNIKEIDDLTYLSVSDNGIGIESKYFERIFRIFERLNIGEGTGVGLAIVKTIAEKHGGKIYVESEYQIGSTFTLVLPQPSADED